MSISTISRRKLSLGVKTLYSAIALVCAVALPQLFHLMGTASGLGSALGETLLPMHLPIMLVGLLAGSYAGALAGFFAPLVSFMLTAMPRPTLLPFMMIELCCYGLIAGLLSSKKLPTTLKVLTVQIAGRALRAVAIMVGVYCFDSALSVNIIWTSITSGLFGIVLQLVLIPLIVFRIEGGAND